MSCCNRVKSSMLNTIDGNYSIWIDHSKKNTRNVPKDMTKLFFFMTTLDHMLQNKWKKFWRHLDEMSYPTRPIHQTLLLHITICFGRCSMIFLSSTSVISKISKNCSMTGSLQKNLNFSTAESICYPKSEKRL